MSVNRKLIRNNPESGNHTAVLHITTTGGVAKINAVSASTLVMGAYATQGHAMGTGSYTIAGVMVVATSGPVHIFTTNTAAAGAGVPLAVGQRLYIPGPGENLEIACAGTFTLMVFWNEN